MNTRLMTEKSNGKPLKSAGGRKMRESAGQVEDRMLLTVEEAAQLLGIGRTLAWRLVQERELPSVRLGRCVRVPRHELEVWIQEHTEDRTRGG